MEPEDRHSAPRSFDDPSRPFENGHDVGARSVYGASKAAVRSFARCWTTEVRHRRIRVNVLGPGPIETPIRDKVGGTREQIEQFKAEVLAATPMGRMGTPVEVGKDVVFLASDDSSYVTGTERFVDGGFAQV